MTNISALKQRAEELLDKLEGGKRYLLGDVHKRLSEVRADYPQDTVIQSVSHVIEKMYEKSPNTIISQADIENIYQELVGLNASGTKFREVVGDLLQSETVSNANENEGFVNSLRNDPDKGEVVLEANQEVKSEFEKLFGYVSDNYNPQLATDAKEKVGLELVSLGFDRHRVRLAGGNSRFLVFAADLDTNRGAVRVYIPTDASGEKLPSVFVAGNKFETLTTSNLQAHVEESALRNDRLPEVRAILATLDSALGNAPKSMSEEDFNKIASNLPDTKDVLGNGIYTELPDPKNDIGEITVPNTPLPESLKPIASQVEENVIESTVGYPQHVVRLAKRIILAELIGMGFKGSQLRVSEPTNDGFICQASINTPKGKAVVEIPIEIKNNIPLMPSIFASEDYVAEFNASNLCAFAAANSSVGSVIDRDNPMMIMSIHELKDIVARAVISGDHDKCDEVMEVVAERFDEDTYRALIIDYQKMLKDAVYAEQNLKMAYDDPSQFVHSPNSIYPIHKKLGRPANELIRDENGEYHLKSTYYSRKNEGEGAFFSNAKVLVGE